MGTARAERRLAAILAADVVGYSHLIEQDEDGTLSALKELRRAVIDPCLDEHHGRIVKLMGDGAIVEFGSVVDAVRCADLIQKGVAESQADVPIDRRIVFRIGINLGDVVVEDGDLFGDGVNIAARLEQICPPGGVMISGTAYDHLQGKLALPLAPAGEQRVKNIERPIRTYLLRPGRELPRRLAAIRSMRWAEVAGLFLLICSLAVIAFWISAPRHAGTGKPGLAVLPFDNLSQDEVTGRLADGITEDIITDLARFRDLSVIARNSTASYKGSPVDVREVAKRLDVGYILEGSIQRQDENARVTAQLIDASTGAHVWSDRWNRPLGDIFAVQSELAEAVASKIGGYTGKIAAAGQDAAKRKRPGSLSAYDLYLMGVDAKHRVTRDSVEEAIRLLKQSLEQDPGLARAWTALAWSYGMLRGFVDETDEMRRARHEAASRAVQIDPSDAEAHAAFGSVLGDEGELVQAEAELDRAMNLNPGSADILTFYANWGSTFGKPEKGVEAAQRAIRLNPNMPTWALGTYAYAFFMVGRYEEALRFVDQKLPETRRRSDLVYRAVSLSELGRTEEARAAVAEALKQHPSLTIERFAIFEPGWSEHERQRFVETMRKAGFPACAANDDRGVKMAPKRLPECVSG